MRELTEDEVRGLQWGDADFYGFYWDARFDDPTLVVRLSPANSPIQELVCGWATRLKLDVQYKDHINSLLTWDVVFNRLTNGGWNVIIDLASHGSMEFECNSLSVRPVADTPAV